MFYPVNGKPYQKEALKKNRAARADGTTKVVNVLASGLGKTVLAGLDARDYLSESTLVRPRVLVLNGNIQLLQQIEHEFREKVFGHEYSYGVFNGAEKTSHVTDFLFATFDSMRVHLDEFKADEFAYIFIDEAHHAQATTYSKVIQYFQPERMLAVTATPLRMDGKDITEICGPIVYRLELEEAIARNLTAGVDYRLCLDEIEKIQLFLESGEPVSWKKLNSEIFVPKRDEEIIATVQKDAADLYKTDVFMRYTHQPTTIYFCRSIRHANRIAKLLPNSTVVHSHLSEKEVARRLKKFRRGEVKTIVAVDMLNEGIDIPRTDVVVFLRSTRSWTVFLQQLGRGLRLAEGKGAVRVYDFVGTATALEKIIALEKRVNDYARENGIEEKPNFELKINAGKFHVDKVDIIKLLEHVRNYNRSFTREALLKALRDFHARTGRIPNQDDLKPANGMPSHETYRKYFGSWRLALFEAGLISEEDLAAYSYTKEDLIAIIRAKAEEVGKTPTKRDFDANIIFHRATVLFGGWNKAVEAAGLKPNKRPIKLSNEELLEKLRQKAKKLGRCPTCAEVDADPDMPKAHVYERHFKSYNKAAELAGLTPNKRHIWKQYSREQLIDGIKMMEEKLGRPPHIAEMCSKNGVPSAGVYGNVFGSWDAALEAAGITKDQAQSKKKK